MRYIFHWRGVYNVKKPYALLFVLALVISLMSGCVSDSSSQSSGSTNTDAPAEQPEETAVILADDDCVTATFEKMYDATSMGVEGVFYIDVNVENKTDKEIWVYLDKASVNDEMVPLVGSGVPLYIQPAKSGRNGFIFSFSSLSVDSIDEVKSVNFDLVVADKESMKEIERVESVSLEF